MSRSRVRIRKYVVSEDRDPFPRKASMNNVPDVLGCVNKVSLMVVPWREGDGSGSYARNWLRYV